MLAPLRSASIAPLSTLKSAILMASVIFLTMHSCNYGEIDLDVQGHRGCRGLMPENTLAGFQKAWELGVTTLEMDVVISHDRQVIVSHEPWFSHLFCLDPLGQPIREDQELGNNIYLMDYAEVAKWDCGAIGNSNFPEQQKIKAAKPLLSEVFDAIELQAAEEDYTEEVRMPHYNIEVKLEAKTIGTFHPDAKDFVALVLAQIHERNLVERCTLQCFELEPLREARRQEKAIALGLLVDTEEDYQAKIAQLGFYPEVLSPDWQLVDAAMLTFAAEKNMKVVPWTVNTEDDMRKMVKLGVHGIITDYPDRLLTLLKVL